MNIKVKLEDLNDPKKASELEKPLMDAFISDPENPDVLVMLGIVKCHKGLYDEAVYLVKKGIGLAPFFGGGYIALSGIYSSIGEFGQAREALELALKLGIKSPALYWNYSLALLKDKEFTKGWDIYRWRKIHLAHHVRFLKPDFDPYTTKAEGTLLLWPEQGLGDQLMMMRFIPDLLAMGFEKIIIESRPELYSLYYSQFQDTPEVTIFVQNSDLNCPYDFDHHMSIMDLCYMLQVQPEDIFKGPYIKTPEFIVSHWAECLNDVKTKIGICWAGSPGHVNDKNRSANLDIFVPLIQNDPFISLTKDGEYPIPNGMKLLNVAPGMVNLEYTAGLIEIMDVVITVDSCIAHLAGALGKETFLLLPYVNEWRWGTGKGSNLWYHSVTMFKQEKPGDWSKPIQDIKEYGKTLGIFK